MPRADACATCGSATVKYPCRHCIRQTCSLACFKTHEAACAAPGPTQDGVIANSTSPKNSPAVHLGASLSARRRDVDSSLPRYARPSRRGQHQHLIPEQEVAALCKAHPTLRARLAEYYGALTFARHASTSEGTAKSVRADVAWDVRRAAAVSEVQGRSREHVVVEDGDVGLAALTAAARALDDGEDADATA